MHFLLFIQQFIQSYSKNIQSKNLFIKKTQIIHSKNLFIKKIQNDSFKDFINSRKNPNDSFKKNIHSNENGLLPIATVTAKKAFTVHFHQFLPKKCHSGYLS